MNRAILAFALSAAGPLAAEPFLHWPVDCAVGKTCFVEDHVDRDPGAGARDFSCGLNTRDGHTGVDIAIPDFNALEAPGVAVVAAAAGSVTRTRDGMVDDWRMPGVTSQNACGNAVIINHHDGWETWYCHLAQGSVAVQPGDLVQPGDPIGTIGLSGQTTHPHLHFRVRKDGQDIDPFDSDGTLECGGPTPSIWLETPVYHKTLLHFAGFSNSVPDYKTFRAGRARIDVSAPDQPLVVYAEVGFAEHGDIVTITATGPQGEVFRHSRVMKSPRNSQLPAFGKRAPKGGWPPGEYLGQITLTRGDTLVANRWAHVTVRR